MEGRSSKQQQQQQQQQPAAAAAAAAACRSSVFALHPKMPLQPLIGTQAGAEAAAALVAAYCSPKDIRV